jgi:hypothetical protein
MKTCGGLIPAFLTLALYGGDFSNSRPGHEIGPAKWWIGGQVVPRAVLESGKIKIST